LDRLWSPWRSKYIESFKPGAEKDGGCLFCKVFKEDKDEENFVLHRGTRGYIIMNLYPYNSGHLMVVPYKHTSRLDDLGADEVLGCMSLVNLACKVLDDSVYPQGYNIGMNLGRCSGAGIDEHLHFHIVPRWNGDTNFMPVLNDVKVVSEMMEETYKKLQVSLAKILQR